MTATDQDVQPAEDPSPEVAPVRAGDELDWNRLEAYLRANIADLDGEMEALQFPYGSANLTYLLRFGPTELVLRRPPRGTIAPGAHDMKREHKVLSRLWQHWDKAPRSYLLCEDHDVIGADFFVMERREGIVIREVLPPEMAHHDRLAERTGLALADAMAEFHALDPDTCGLADLGRPDGFVERQVSGWKKRWDLAEPADGLPLMHEVHARLERAVPTPTRVSFVHNDLKLDNAQFDADDPDRVKSIFDWDMTTVGDPLIDLGTLLNYWPDPADERSRALREGMDQWGLPTRAALTQRYATAAGIDVDQVAWYEAFALWKTAVVIQQLYNRYLEGATQDDRMAQRAYQIGERAEAAAAVLTSAGL